MGIARLLLRLTIGTLFIGHGCQKLFGSFGGEGLSKTAATFEKLGLRPGHQHALAASAAEIGGGALLAAGYAAPLAAATLTAQTGRGPPTVATSTTSS
jgi:putative oxidoreductase